MSEPRVIVTYSHRHGTDVWACASYEAAWASACRTIVEFWDEIGDRATRDKIRACLRAGAHEDAVEAWREYQERFLVGEALELTSLPPTEDGLEVPEPPPESDET